MASLLLNALEIQLLQRLNTRATRYLVVGGHAVAYHGHHREMQDLDIFIANDMDNARRMVAALRGLGFDDDKLTAEKLTQPNTHVPLGKPYHVELHTSLAGIDFDGAYRRRATSAEPNLFAVPVIGLLDLRITKALTATAKDRADLKALELLAKRNPA